MMKAIRCLFYTTLALAAACIGFVCVCRRINAPEYVQIYSGEK